MELDRKRPGGYTVVALLVGAAVALACGGGGGATFGENAPGDPQYGGGTYLDDATAGGLPVGVGGNGSLAVDPDTESVFTVQVRKVNDPECAEAPCARVEEKRLVAVSPEGDARVMMDLRGYRDVRVLFPPESVLVLAEPELTPERAEKGICRAGRCGDEMHWFSKTSLRPLRSKQTNARYHGTRLSVKRNWLAVADNFQSPAPLHLVDTATGDINVVPQDGDWFEAMWLHHEDAMITAHFNGLIPDGTEQNLFLTIREWFPERGRSGPVPGQTVCFFSEGPVPADCESIAIPEFAPLQTVGFSWIGVSQDDRWVAVPAQKDGEGVVVLIDRETRDVEFVANAYGPVGFTPDHRTMVAYGWDDEEAREGAHLILVDLETMEIREEPVPDVATPSFFVSHDSNDVIAVNYGGGEQLILVDLDSASATTMAGPVVASDGAAYSREFAEKRRAGAQDVITPGAAERREALRRRSALRLPSEQCLDLSCVLDAPVPMTLTEFVSRQGHRELWFVEGGTLLRLDLEMGRLANVAIDAVPEHINIRPNADRLVLDSRGEQKVHFFDPARWAIDRTVSIALGWESEVSAEE